MLTSPPPTPKLPENTPMTRPTTAASATCTGEGKGDVPLKVAARAQSFWILVAWGEGLASLSEGLQDSRRSHALVAINLFCSTHTSE